MNPIKRLRKEADEADKVSDKDVRVLLKESDDLKQWDGVIRGPPGSPYEDHVFKLFINVGDRYPLAPPTITFLTKIFHPNIHFDTGEICLDVLKHDWTPAWSLSSALRAIASILSEPNAESPLNCDAGNMIRAGDMQAFNAMARLYTVEFAEVIPERILKPEEESTLPTITSGATGIDLAENSGAGQTVYTITADANDGGTISSYAIGGTDDPLLEVNSSTGVVSLTANPDYETKNSYSFTATATNAAGTSAATTVTFSITNVIEVPSSTE